MNTNTIGVERMEHISHEECVVHFTDQTSFSVAPRDLAACILENTQLQRMPAGKLPIRRCYMKEWPGRL